MRTQRGPRTTESGAARRPREVVQLRCCCFAVRSAAVAVGVARQGALDVVPAVAHRVAGVVPGQARVVFGTALLPVPLQVGLDLLEPAAAVLAIRSEEHTSELQSREKLVCRLLLETKNRI